MLHAPDNPGDAVAAYDPAVEYGAAFTKVGPAQPAGGGFSGAGVWKVETAAGAVALRLWPAAPPPRARLAGLHGLLAHVARRDPGVPVAVPVATSSGETLVRVGGRLAQLEPWRPGGPLGVDPAVGGPSRRRAGALARFHRAAEEYETDRWGGRLLQPGRRGAEPPSLATSAGPAAAVAVGHRQPGATGTREPPPPEAFRDLAGRLLARLTREGPALLASLDGLASTPVPLSCVLRDVHREHILITDAGTPGAHVTGLIDPSAALADSPAADLARLTVSLAPDRLDELIACYRNNRPLGASEGRPRPRAGRRPGPCSAGWRGSAGACWTDTMSPRTRPRWPRLRHFAAWRS